MKAVIFDFGNVIINIDVPRTFEAFSQISGKSPQKIKALFEQFDVFRRYELGFYKDDEFRESIRQIIGFPFNDKEIDEAWNALLLDVPPSRIELIKLLSINYELFLLSNTNSIHINFCDQLFFRQFGIKNVKSLFKKAFYSFELGLYKPDPKIYQYVLNDIGFNKKEVLFLDDNQQNIEAAKAVGIPSHLITKEEDIHFYLDKYL